MNRHSTIRTGVHSRSCQGFVRLLISLVLIPLLWSCAVGRSDLGSASDSLSEAPYEYVIGPGDNLEIFVWGYEDLSVSLPVRPDGRITTRLVEDMLASGKTPTELARDIETAYRSYVKNPTVSITVSKFVGSPNQQIRVVGGGAKPRTVPYRNSMTLLDLMIEVGGLDKFASGNRAVLVRTIAGERSSHRVRINDLLEQGDISANVDLYPGDVLIIPESWF